MTQFFLHEVLNLLFVIPFRPEIPWATCNPSLALIGFRMWIPGFWCMGNKSKFCKSGWNTKLLSLRCRIDYLHWPIVSKPKVMHIVIARKLHWNCYYSNQYYKYVRWYWIYLSFLRDRELAIHMLRWLGEMLLTPLQWS